LATTHSGTVREILVREIDKQPTQTDGCGIILHWRSLFDLPTPFVHHL
jgi:hypothetical protein